MRIAVVGVSHPRAPLAVRERVALTSARARCLVAGVVEAGDATEAVAVVTCNRTELYLAGPGPDAAGLVELALSELHAIAGEGDPIPADAFSVYHGEAAVVHLYRVASGIESMVPGEAEILGQIRHSLAQAREETVAGPILSRLFESAIDVGRRVRSETAIGETAASVGSVAATLARDFLGSLEGRRVLVIGAGKTSELVAVNLLARGAAEIRVANRTVSRAEELALKLGGDAVPIETLPVQLAWADAAITATNAPHWIIEKTDVEVAIAGRPQRPLVLIDLAVPRDIEPAARELDGVTLLDLDDLERVVDTNRSLRLARGVDGQATIAAEAERFLRWRSSLDVVPTIASLRALGEHVRATELVRVEGRWESLSEHDRELVDRVTRSIVAKLLHEPTVRIKDLASTEDATELAQTLARIFPLEAAPAPVRSKTPLGGQAA